MQLKSIRTLAVGVFAVVTLLFLLTAIAGFIYETQSGRQVATAESVATRGELRCTGEGSPTVLFFLSNSVPAVGRLSSDVGPVVEEFATVCRRIYVGPNDWDPPTGERLVTELHDVLREAQAEPPYVLVGFSLGGLVARWFDASFPGEVAGFVFVDSSHPDMESIPNYVPQPPPLRLPSWLIASLRKSGFLRLMLSEKFPSWIAQPRSRLLLSGYFVDHQIMKQARQLDWSTDALGARPIVVLTKDTYVTDANRSSWIELQNEFADLSSDTRHQVVIGSEHAIWIRDPEAVVDAIRDVVDSVRGDSR